MRFRVVLLAAVLLTFLATVPAAEAKPDDPVGWCDAEATVEVCSYPCIPEEPCPVFVCVNAGQRICSND